MCVCACVCVWRGEGKCVHLHACVFLFTFNDSSRILRGHGIIFIELSVGQYFVCVCMCVLRDFVHFSVTTTWTLENLLLRFVLSGHYLHMSYIEPSHLIINFKVF